MNPLTQSKNTTILPLLIALGVALPAAAQNPNSQNLYGVLKLQSDVPGEAAATDPDLVNGWGIAAGPTSPWWVADNGTSKSTLYDGNTGAKVPLVVTVPGAPTGIVFNGSTDFVVTMATVSGPAIFIFATDDGQIAGWNPTVNLTNAISAVTTPGAVYLGLAIASSGGANHLYAANFSAARVDVFDNHFALVHLPGGDFTDPDLPNGYAPFGIQTIGGEIYIAYALQNEDGDEEVAGEGPRLRKRVRHRRLVAWPRRVGRRA
jgi:uncharacterized protein (TIGR03118 family)